MSNASHSRNMSAPSAIERLREGNQRYVAALTSWTDVCPALRALTARHGQEPYAIVITCSDSRVIPEAIFSASIGDLFVIRVAGNVIDDHQLGSIEYAASHLGVNLVLVLGHTHCGAVGAAMGEDAHGYIKYVVDDIKQAIGDETDDREACRLNVEHSMDVIESSLEIQKEETQGMVVRGAIYDIASGVVDFL